MVLFFVRFLSSSSRFENRILFLFLHLFFLFLFRRLLLLLLHRRRRFPSAFARRGGGRFPFRVRGGSFQRSRRRQADGHALQDGFRREIVASGAQLGVVLDED